MRLYMNGLADSVRNKKTKLLVDPYAAALSLEALDGVYRFIGDHIITDEYRETTAAHVERCVKNGERFLEEAMPKGHQRTYVATIIRTRIGVHDNGEIFGEPVTAKGEMDPELQAELALYCKPGETEQKIAHFNYALGLRAKTLKSSALYHDTVQEIRGKVLPADWTQRGMNNPELVHFYKTSETEMSRFSERYNLGDKRIQQSVGLYAQHYADIEQERDFLGCIGKIIEKSDGTNYKNSVSAQRKEKGQAPYNWHEPGIEHVQYSLPRYEKNLSKLYAMSEQPSLDVPQKADRLNITFAAVKHCYATSVARLEQAKDYVTLVKVDSEPKGDAPQEKHEEFIASMRRLDLDDGDDSKVKPRSALIRLYTEAVDDATRGILWLPETGKCLATSAADKIQKIETVLYKPKIIHTLS